MVVVAGCHPRHRCTGLEYNKLTSKINQADDGKFADIHRAGNIRNAPDRGLSLDMIMLPYSGIAINLASQLHEGGVNDDSKKIVNFPPVTARFWSCIMKNAHIVSLDSLLNRLEAVLGRDSLLFRRFEEGLRFEDERRLTDAMSSLRLYPEAVRRVVEDTVMSWLFGAREEEMAQNALTPGV